MNTRLAVQANADEEISKLEGEIEALIARLTKAQAELAVVKSLRAIAQAGQ